MGNSNDGSAAPEDGPNVVAGLTRVRVALMDAESEVDRLMLAALSEELPDPVESASRGSSWLRLP